MVSYGAADEGRDITDCDGIFRVHKKRAIAVKSHVWWGQGAEIGHGGRLAMGQDRDVAGFCHGQPDGRRGVGVRRDV